MADTILLDHYQLPQQGFVRLQLDCSFDIQVTAQQARRAVDQWLLDEVSTTIGAGEPILAVDGQSAVWRVPAIFTATHVGEIGVVGTVDVDVQSGAMTNTASCKATILQRAQRLAAKMPRYTPRSTSAETYVAYDQQPTVTAPQGDPFAILAYL
jgi:hypothetical protein